MNKQKQNKKRTQRVRNSLNKANNKYRLSIFKSNRHIYAQLIDDSKSETIVSASTLNKKAASQNCSHCNKKNASIIGKLIAERAQSKNIEGNIVFDRGPNLFHGVIKELANSARAAGLKF